MELTLAYKDFIDGKVSGVANFDWLVLQCEARRFGESQPSYELKYLTKSSLKSIQRRLQGSSGDSICIAAVLINTGHNHFITKVNDVTDNTDVEKFKIYDDIKPKNPKYSRTGAVAVLVVNKTKYPDYKSPIIEIARNFQNDCMASACSAFFLSIPQEWWLKTLDAEDIGQKTPMIDLLRGIIVTNDNNQLNVDRGCKNGLMTIFGRQGTDFVDEVVCVDNFMKELSKVKSKNPKTFDMQFKGNHQKSLTQYDDLKLLLTEKQKLENNVRPMVVEENQKPENTVKPMVNTKKRKVNKLPLAQNDALSDKTDKLRVKLNRMLKRLSEQLKNGHDPSYKDDPFYLTLSRTGSAADKAQIFAMVDEGSGLTRSFNLDDFKNDPTNPDFFEMIMNALNFF